MYTTITELIDGLEELQELYGENMPIAFSYDYGDHCRSRAVQTINNIDEVIAEEWQGGLKRIITGEGDGDGEGCLGNECKNCYEDEGDYQKILVLR